jgi:preprotein translocase subunit SecD
VPESLRDRALMHGTHVTSIAAGRAVGDIGSGPVRGFALTLGIGIITTVFTAFTLTRLMIASWFRWFRPRVVPI